MEGGIGLDLPSINSFIVARLGQVRFFDNETFKVREDVSLPIKLLPAEAREPNQVIKLVKSHDEELIAVISGRLLVMNEQQINQLFLI